VERKKLVSAVLRRVEKEVLEEEDAVVGEGEMRHKKRGWGAWLDKVQERYAQLVSIGGNRRALAIACMLQGAQQLCGFVSCKPCMHILPARILGNP